MSSPQAATPPEALANRPPRVFRRRSKVHAWLHTLLMVVRRSHLYLGLLLMPWALLYGVTGYLFNHPGHFPDRPLRTFGPSLLEGTPLSSLDGPQGMAEQVVEALNRRFVGSERISLSSAVAAHYSSNFLFAKAELPGKTVQLLLYGNGDGGTVFEQPRSPAPAPAKTAHFAIAPDGGNAAESRVQAGAEARPSHSADATSAASEQPPLPPHRAPLHLEAGLERAAQGSLPLLAKRLGIQLGGEELRLTSVPDLEFSVRSGVEEWTVKYNALAGSIVAAPAPSLPQASSSWRRFLTQMHVAHGYAGQEGARWLWAIVVDVMAFVMVFWGLSGIAMWWQLKRIRPWGTVALCVSLTLALLLGMGMFEAIR
ncbi:MAG: hypothetical protein KDA45_01080 [Planctomycetales bacterium]|nr:hypothetical protein [Planctomycetales bacterium]